MPVLACPAEISVTELASALEAFLAENPRATVFEDGRMIFDMQQAQYGISTERGRCVLQVWSEQCNVVRTVTGLQVRKDSLKLEARRFGQTKPQSIHLLADRDVRTPSSRSASRTRYLKLLEHVVPRAFGDWRLDGLRSAMDLEHSFGPAYARGELARGQSAWALIGVSAEETPCTIDGVLTLGILWLHYCRERAGNRRVIEGLKVIVPAGWAELTRSRMAWLDPALAKWELYELNAATEDLTRIETDRNGNLAMRLHHAFELEAALGRMAASLNRILAILPEGTRSIVDIRARNAAEIFISLHGLEFARVRQGPASGSFSREDRITFGAGARETALTADSEPMLRELVARLFASRHAEGDTRDPLFRLQPERWMESCLRQRLAEVEPDLRSDRVYQQVPAFAAGDRGMLDLLTTTRGGRLAVLELKTDDDFHMPLQGLDYWIRVHQLHTRREMNALRGAFEQAGYFPGQVLSPAPPLLFFIAPALRVHPTTETILRCFSQEIDWTLLAVNEAWRSEPKVIWRKRGGSARAKHSYSRSP